MKNKGKICCSSQHLSSTRNRCFCCATSWSRKVKNGKHRPKHATKQCCATSWGFLCLVFRCLNSRLKANLAFTVQFSKVMRTKQLDTYNLNTLMTFHFFPRNQTYRLREGTTGELGIPRSWVFRSHEKSGGEEHYRAKSLHSWRQVCIHMLKVTILITQHRTVFSLTVWRVSW